MAYLIGTDEAGYGPNLGPLVISATVWQIPDEVRGEELYDRLAQVIDRKPNRDLGRIAIADSKDLYQQGRGLMHLERGLLAALGVLERRPRSWRELWDVLDPQSAGERCALPWHVDYDGALPAESDARELDDATGMLRAGLAAAGVRLLNVTSRAIFPEGFNQLLSQQDSKGAMLSHATLGLVAEELGQLPDGPVLVVCDKHGGRNRYRDLLEDHFIDQWVGICGEGRQQSVYRFGSAERPVEICFQMQAEQWLPVALASMASKYLREMAMRAFNHFWLLHLPHVRPTAGYPQDAKRFLADIADVQSNLAIENRILWRSK